MNTTNPQATTTPIVRLITAIKKFLANNEFNRLVTKPLGVNRLVTVEVRS